METNNTNSSSNKGLFGLFILAIIGLLIFAFYFRGPIDDEPEVTDIKPPAQVIDIKDARELTREYANGRYNIINDSLFKNSKIKDTREFWIPLDTIKKYIRYVEFESEKKGYKDLGIRIYNAAYPKNSPDPRADPGFSTVILTPTKGRPRIGNGFFPMAPVQDPADGISSLNYVQGGKPPKDL